jgi:hypothetical protein
MKTLWDAQYGDINYLIVENEIVFSLYADQAGSATFSAIMASVKALGAIFRQVHIDDLIYERLGNEPEDESDELAKWLKAEGAEALFAPFEIAEPVDGSTEEQQSINEDCAHVAEDDGDSPALKECAYHLGATHKGLVGCITTRHDGEALKKPRWYKISTRANEIDIEFYADGYDPKIQDQKHEIIQDLWIEVPNVGDTTPTYRMTDNTKVLDETIQIYPK